MSSDFDPEIDDTAVSAIEGVVDNNGVLRLQAPSISSYNFDGFIPAEQFNYSASAITPGMKISFTGSAENQQYYSILYVDDTDEIFSASPSSIITIQYLDEDYLVQEIAIAASAIMPVVIENWNNKYIGQEGWHITNSGNAIFSNVAVRGRIEATEGEISGDLTLGGSLTASTNNGQLIISSSGIFGSTASGLFHLDNIDGEITFTGNINAKGGSLEYLTIGDNYFPIHNIIGSASYQPELNYNGAIILTIYQSPWNPNILLFPNSGFQYPSLVTTTVKRYMAQGDHFQLNGVSASGVAININTGQSYSQSQTNSILNNTWRVESASVGFIDYSASLVLDRYFCVQYNPFAFNTPLYNFENLSASSGSFTNGFLFSGEYNVKNGQSLTRIDGLTFSSINAGTTWNNYIPDFIDLSGRLRLANGYIRNTTNTASGTSSGLYIRGSLQNIRPTQTTSASFFRPSLAFPSSSQRIDIERIATNYIYEINPITASCVFLIDTNYFGVGDYFDVVNIGTGSIIFKSFTASIDSYLDKKVLVGKWSSATIRKRSSNSLHLYGNLS